MKYAIYRWYPGWRDWSYYCVCTGPAAVMENIRYLRMEDFNCKVRYEPCANPPVDLRGYL